MRYALSALLLAFAAPAEAKWREASTAHFVIYSEQSSKSLEEFATKLERFDSAMRLLRNIPDEPLGQANRVTVYVVSDLAKVRELAGESTSSGDLGIAGFYIPRATGSIAITPRSTGGNESWELQALTVLLHEYAHHFMMQNFAVAFPAWFVEGYAEFMASAVFAKDQSVGLGAPAHHRAYGLLSGNPLPIEKLLTSSQHKLTLDQQEAVYGRGWLLTHYLTFEPARQGQLNDYLSRLNRGESGLDAAKAAFGDLKKLERELNSYLNRSRLNYWKLSAEKTKAGTITVRELTSAEEAVMDVKIRSKRGVDAKEAKALVPLARKAAAPFPKDAAAQVMLAEAEYDAGNYREAEAAADRALAAAPKSAEALIYKGRARMALAEADPSSGAATWQDVRKWFLAANEVDAEDPEPLILFYQSFLAEGERPTANAAAGLAYALNLAPHDMGLRMTVAHQHLIDGKGAEAHAALAPVAYNPHGGKMAEIASTIMAKINSEGVKAALSVSEGAAAVAEEEESASPVRPSRFRPATAHRTRGPTV
jgi:tetratricopeptide (TPR) repeat protein